MVLSENAKLDFEVRDLSEIEYGEKFEEKSTSWNGMANWTIQTSLTAAK